MRTEQAAQVTVPSTLPTSALEWSSCPDLADDLSTEWECTWVDAPLDHADPAGDTISVALSRPVLDEGDTRRPLVLNPGGPGGSGIELAWYLIDLLPPDLLDEYYPVGWDPRGVGRSLPAVDCGDFDDFAIPDVQTCIDRTGPLLAQVGAADSALDLDHVRAALGVERLDYLGYSYGTALGAVYAMAHPDRVGRFVLDGAFDPTAGDPDGPLASDGMPDYAADETDARDRPLPRAVRCVRGVCRRSGQPGARRRARGDDPRPADGRVPRRAGADGTDRPRRADGRGDVRPVVVGARSATPCATAPTATPPRSPR